MKTVVQLHAVTRIPLIYGSTFRRVPKKTKVKIIKLKIHMNVIFHIYIVATSLSPAQFETCMTLFDLFDRYSVKDFWRPKLRSSTLKGCASYHIGKRYRAVLRHNVFRCSVSRATIILLSTSSSKTPFKYFPCRAGSDVHFKAHFLYKKLKIIVYWWLLNDQTVTFNLRCDVCCTSGLGFMQGRPLHSNHDEIAPRIKQENEKN